MGSVSALGCRGVLSLSLVFDISDESTVVISGVGHDLGTTVGEGHAVFTVDNTFGVLGFRLVEAGARVVILDSVLVGERLRGQFLNFVGSGVVRGGGGFVGGGSVGRGAIGDGVGEGSSQDSGENDGLQKGKLEIYNGKKRVTKS